MCFRVDTRFLLRGALQIKLYASKCAKYPNRSFSAMHYVESKYVCIYKGYLQTVIEEYRLTFC